MSKKKGLKKIIHVHQQNIRHNSKCEPEDRRPPIIVRTYKGSKHYWNIEIKGDSKIVYDAETQLSCGARLWIETNSEVIGDIVNE